MSFIGKIHRIQSIIHLCHLKRKNWNADFKYEGDLLNPRIDVVMCSNSKCHMKQIWGGRGDVLIGIYGEDAEVAVIFD